jgi:KDO2-lipid IV(A) lauroyltransferase
MGIINYFVYLILLFVGFISSKLSVRGRNRFGVLLGDFLRILSKKREIITYENISKAFPEYSKAECYDILVESYRNLGITLAELVSFYSLSEDDFKNYVKFENIELIDKLKQKGKGILFLSAHFGNWELIAYAIGLMTDVPVTVIVKHQKKQICG